MSNRINTKQEIKYQFITLLLLFCLPTFSFGNEIDSTKSKSIQEIIALKNDIQKKTSILLNIAKNANDATFNKNIQVIPHLRVINTGCQVFENQFDTDFPILSPNINDEFLILQQDDNWFEIKLIDGRNAWMEEDCAQRFNKTSEKKLGRIKSVSNKSDQIKLANYVFEELNIILEEAEKKSEKIRKNKRITEAELEILAQVNTLINQYKTLSASAYYQYITPENDIINYTDFINKISFIAEIQLGGSDFSMVQNEFSQLSQKGIIGDFLLDASYRVNKNSNANFTISNTSDIVQTPYSNSLVETGYSSKFKNLTWNAGLSYNKYNDKFNTFNKYNRIGGRIGALQKVNRKTTVRLDYNLNANNYTDFEGINFTNHSVNLRSSSILSSSKKLSIELRTNAQFGQEERRNFILLYPELKYTVKKQASSSQYFINFQKYSFANLGLRDTDRLMLGIRNTKQKSKRSNVKYLGLSAKLFNNKPTYNYYQIDSRISSNWNNNNAAFTNFGIRLNYYPEQINLNFSDIQFSFGTNGKIFYNFSTFNRFYYSSEPLINILDANLRTGFSIKGFRFGPSVSVHALLNAENFAIEQDGNFYRFGAFAEGNLRLPYQINISLMSAYDYGFVYSQQFSQDGSTGELTFGDVNERHPTTFQLNSTITTSVIQNVDLFFRLNMYVIDTDITSTISRDPIEQHTRFTARLGARYRFN